MANQTITKTPDRARSRDIYGTWDDWSASNVGTRALVIPGAAAYAVDIGATVPVSACSLSVSIRPPSGIATMEISCAVYETDPTTGSSSPAQTKQISGAASTQTHTFSFSQLGIETGSVYFLITGHFYDGGGTEVLNAGCVITSPSASATFTAPTLSVGVAPSSVSAGGSVALTFSNRMGQALTVRLKYNSTQLTSLTSTSDSASVTTSFNWFTTAGATGLSMRVDVSVTDALGRSATASFTLTREALGLSVSPSNVDVGASVALSLSNRYSKSIAVTFKNSSTVLKTMTVSANSASVTPTLDWFTTAGTTGSMRVDVTASDGTGRTAAANFTLTMPALAVSVSPASIYINNNGTLSFSNRLSRALTVQLKYGSTVLQTLSVNSDSVTVTPTGAWFTTAGVTASSMRVDVAVTDDIGRTASTYFTAVNPQASTVTPQAPKNQQVNGGEPITFSWTVSSDWGAQTKAEIRWSTDNANWNNLSAVNSSATVKTVDAFLFPAGTVYWQIRVTNSYGIRSSWTNSTSFTVAFETLAVSVSPSTAIVGNAATMTFSNRLGQPLTVQLKYSSTVLQTLSVDSDSVNVTPTEAWFTTAGVTAYSMRVDVAVTDGIGRTASANFTAQKPQASTVTPTAPKNTTADGSQKINFAWTVSDDWGAQTKAELQWSTDNAVWSNLATISSSAKTYAAAAYKFPSGRIYWRLRVTNSYGIRSAWTSSVYFTVSFPTLSVGVSPSSVYIGSKATLRFANRLSRALTIECKYNDTSLKTLNVASDAAIVTPTAAWFETAQVSGSSMQVTVSVSDDLGRSATTHFTAVSPQGSTATPQTPKGTTAVDGAAAIAFTWTVSTDWGTQTKAELQWSTDGAEWQYLTTVNGAGTSWQAPVARFPSGTLYWRIRVTNSFGILGDWSSATSFKVQYDAVSYITPVNSATSGLINAGAARVFQIAMMATGRVYNPFTIASAVFHWRVGTSGDWTDVAMTNGANNQVALVTIPAETFQPGVVQWYASATDNTGRTTQTEVYTLTALIAEIQAKPLRPINTVESGSGPITLAWEYASVDATPQAAAQIKYSADGETWTTVDVGGEATSWTAAAGTFEAGGVFWQVRAQNSAENWGPWSAAVSFKCFAAPTVAGVSGDGKPFLTVSWQTIGQQTYKLLIDGELYGPYFGPDVRSYTLKDPLPNGAHTVKVAAQNRFGLWSEWAEAEVAVVNVPGPGFFISPIPRGNNILVNIFGATIAPIIVKQPQDYRSTAPFSAYFRVFQKTWPPGLEGNMPADPNFTRQWFERANESADWQEYTGAVNVAGAAIPTASQDIDGHQYRMRLSNAVGEIYSDAATFYYGSPREAVSVAKTGEWRAETGYFLIYRDGKLIGKTYENSFVDRFAVGTHEYAAMQILPGGYYTLANAQVTVTASIDCPVIAPLAGGDWVELRLSENASRTQKFSRQRQTAYIHYAGSKYPDADIGEQEELTGTGDVAFKYDDKANAEAFEALLGKPVVYKTPGGVLIVGILDARQRTDSLYFKAYSFTLRQIRWRDYVDES